MSWVCCALSLIYWRIMSSNTSLDRCLNGNASSIFWDSIPTYVPTDAPWPCANQPSSVNLIPRWLFDVFENASPDIQNCHNHIQLCFQSGLAHLLFRLSLCPAAIISPKEKIAMQSCSLEHNRQREGGLLHFGNKAVLYMVVAIMLTSLFIIPKKMTNLANLYVLLQSAWILNSYLLWIIMPIYLFIMASNQLWSIFHAHKFLIDMWLCDSILISSYFLINNAISLIH